MLFLLSSSLVNTCLEEYCACTRIFQTVWTKGAPLNEQNSCQAVVSTERAVLRIESGASELEKNVPLSELREEREKNKLT